MGPEVQFPYKPCNSVSVTEDGPRKKGVEADSRLAAALVGPGKWLDPWCAEGAASILQTEGTPQKTTTCAFGGPKSAFRDRRKGSERFI